MGGIDEKLYELIRVRETMDVLFQNPEFKEALSIIARQVDECYATIHSLPRDSDISSQVQYNLGMIDGLQFLKKFKIVTDRQVTQLQKQLANKPTGGDNDGKHRQRRRIF